MLCEYRLTLDDYKAALRLHIRCNHRVRLWFLFCCRLMPVVSIAALALLLWDASFRHFEFPAWFGGMLAGVAFVGLYVPAVRPFMIRRGYRRVMENNGNVERAVQLELRAGELISRIPGRSEGRFQPVAVHDMVRDERICLIYVGKKTFLFIPRESMPDDLWGALATWSGKSRSC